MTTTAYLPVTSGGCTGAVPTGEYRRSGTTSTGTAPTTCTGTGRHSNGTVPTGTGARGCTGTPDGFRNTAGTASGAGRTSTTASAPAGTGNRYRALAVPALDPTHTAKGRTMATALQAVTATATDYSALFATVGRWAAEQPAGLMVLSVTVVSVPGRSEVKAMVAFTERDEPVAVELATEEIEEIEELPSTARPTWVTDELLASSPAQLMYAYLDHNPDTPSLQLEQWARRYFPVSAGYGRTCRHRWLERQRAQRVYGPSDVQ
jgi:hypothetical protein